MASNDDLADPMFPNPLTFDRRTKKLEVFGFQLLPSSPMGGLETRRYERNGDRVDMISGWYGLDPIPDQAVLMYCLSRTMRAMDRNGSPSRDLALTAYDLLKTVNRAADPSGEKPFVFWTFDRLFEVLDRLASFLLRVEFREKGYRVVEGFKLIDSWHSEGGERSFRRMSVEMRLSSNLYDAILGSAAR